MASAAPAPPHWLDGPSRFRQAVGYSVGLAIACLVSYWLITRVLAHIYSVSRLDDLLGGMWAVIATVFVYRNSYPQSVGAPLSRVAATSMSFLLCLGYLLILPFDPWGLAALAGVGTLAVTLMGRTTASPPLSPPPSSWSSPRSALVEIEYALDVLSLDGCS
jgi:small-conductance mechanosensitive channel